MSPETRASSGAVHPIQPRAMVEADLPAVLAIEEAGQTVPWSAQLLAECLDSNYQCSVVEQDGAPIAFRIISRVLDEAHLLNIGVAPGQRRRGIARQLIEQAMLDCAHDGANNMYLEVRASNQPAIALYRALGFQHIGRRKGYYPALEGREDAILMMAGL